MEKQRKLINILAEKNRKLAVQWKCLYFSWENLVYQNVRNRQHPHATGKNDENETN